MVSWCITTCIQEKVERKERDDICRIYTTLTHPVESACWSCRLRVRSVASSDQNRASEWSWSGAPIWFWSDCSVEFQFNLTSATNFWCSSDRPKNTLKVTKKLATLKSEVRSWRQFKSGAQSSIFESEGFRLHTSVQPVEPQTHFKTGRNAFFLPDFQFRFNLTLLQPNVP